MSVIVEQLSKRYGTQKALDGISFEVKPGEVLGFLGPNGAGKSTTMKILTCYIPQSSGRASVNSHDVSTYPIAVRKHIGYLPELNPLYTEMFVKEYLLFTADAYGLGKQANAAAEAMIARTGLQPERRKKISQLSKGYKQRVGLAAAMLHNPPVLILDEPTSGLDPNQVGEIRNLIREFGSEKTVILSTHIMQEVEAMCNRVVIINKGKIVADDTIADIQKRLRKEFIVSVEFKMPVGKAELEAIDQVRQVQSQGNGFVIRAGKDIREELALFATRKQNLILSMNLEESSLEEVFQSLTK